jgi:hypothetical protein
MHAFFKCVCVLAIGLSIVYRALSDVCKQDETGENGLLCVSLTYRICRREGGEAGTNYPGHSGMEGSPGPEYVACVVFCGSVRCN